MGIKAVIFDLDGVICSTDEIHYKAWRAIADEEGIPFSRKDNERLRGVSRMASLEIILEKAKRPYSPEEKETLAEKKNQIYVEGLSSIGPSDIDPGARKALDYLGEHGLKKAIGSSSKNTKRILGRLGIADEFDVIVDGNDIRKSKPDPEVFALAADRLGLPHGECLVVEDAVAGIESARSAGCLAFAIKDARKCPLKDYEGENAGDIVPLLEEENR